MALKALVKDLNDVPENLRGEYKEVEEGEHKGSFLLAVSATDGYSLAQVEKLQKALESERKETKHQKFLAEQFGEVTPEQVKDALAKVKEMDEWDPEKKLAEHKTKFEKDALAKLAKEKGELSEKYQKQIDELSKTSGSAEAELQKVLVRGALVNAIAEAGGKPKLLEAILRDRVKLVVGEDGTRSVRVVDEKGEVQNSKAKDYMEPMTVGELVAEIKEDDDFAAMFQAKAASGSQGAQRVAAGTNGKDDPPPKFNPVESFKAARAGK